MNIDDEVTLNPTRGKTRAAPQGTQVCKFKIPVLRKAITRMRRLKKQKRGDPRHPPVTQMTSRQVMRYLNLRARGTIMKFLQQCTRPRI